MGLSGGSDPYIKTLENTVKEISSSLQNTLQVTSKSADRLQKWIVILTVAILILTLVQVLVVLGVLHVSA